MYNVSNDMLEMCVGRNLLGNFSSTFSI